MKERGYLEESEALAVIADCWLRCSEAFALRGEDIVLHEEGSGPEAGVQQAVLRIGVAERGEAAKNRDAAGSPCGLAACGGNCGPPQSWARAKREVDQVRFRTVS